MSLNTLISLFFVAAGTVSLFAAFFMYVKGKKINPLHYNSLDLTIPPPPPLFNYGNIPPPPPPQEKATYYAPPSNTTEKTHSYRLTVRGLSPQEVASFFSTTKFKVVGVGVAVIVGFLAYLLWFLPAAMH